MTKLVPRIVTVAPERLDRWLAGFGDRHGEVVYKAPSDPEMEGADHYDR